VKLDNLIFNGVVGREIDPAAEPPCVPRFEVADVEVDGWHMGVPGMDNQTDAGGEEGGTFGNLKLGGGAFGEVCAANG
jgi:hypothetical protein